MSVTANVSWTVTDNQSWLSASPTGGTNNGSFTVSATANTGTASRSGTVTVRAAASRARSPSRRPDDGQQPDGVADVAVTGVGCGVRHHRGDRERELDRDGRSELADRLADQRVAATPASR